MDKPKNPYREGTIPWKIMEGWLEKWPEGRWAAMSSYQIATYLKTSKRQVNDAMKNIRERFGEVPHHKPGNGRPQKPICENCAWWKPIDGYSQHEKVCLFCFLNHHCRRRNETGCLEYRRIEKNGRNRVVRSKTLS